MGSVDDTYIPEGWISRTEPWELIDGKWQDEPADLVRNARVQAVRLLNAFGSSIESVLSRPDCTLRDVKIRFFGLCGALGLNLMDGRSWTDLAEEIGCERASLSKLGTEFVNAHNLDPSFMMRRPEACVAYTHSRLDSIAESNAKAKLPSVPPKGRRV